MDHDTRSCIHCGNEAERRLERRLEWATGRNGAALLAELRAEGLDVIETRDEDRP